MSGNKAREESIETVRHYEAPATIFPTEENPGEIFGFNVFTKAVMQKRLPKPVFKSLMATIEHSQTLDPSVADVVAVVMKDWAMEKGATHYDVPQESFVISRFNPISTAGPGWR